MKKILKVIAVTMGLITIGGVISGILDRREERKRGREGKSIHEPYGFYEKYLKRPFDFMLGAAALVVLSPVLLVTALLVRVKLGSPILFSQQRPGRDGKLFVLQKFRSMTDSRDENGKLLPDHDRLTAFGSFLRSASIDELPELYNILRGDMSMIGPRPLLPEYLPYYTETEKHRHDVRPGLSGLAQVSGRNRVGWEERLSYDVEYVEKITFLGDLKILLKTVQKVLKPEDVAADSETVETWLNRERSGKGTVTEMESDEENRQ